MRAVHQLRGVRRYDSLLRVRATASVGVPRQAGAVPGHQDRRVLGGQRVEGGVRPGRVVVEERREALGPGAGGGRVAGDQRVAADEHAGVGEQVGGVAAGVARCGHGHGAAGEVEGPVGQGGGRRHAHRPQGAEPRDGRGPREHPRSPGPAGDVGGRRLLEELAAGVPGLGLAGEHREPVARGQRRETADVVDVGVGDERGGDVARRPADRDERGLDRRGVGGVAAVDQRHRGAVVDEHPVHRRRADEVHAVGDALDPHGARTPTCSPRNAATAGRVSWAPGLPKG
jgi:hypothetical protein